jgi:hypothetical protein
VGAGALVFFLAADLLPYHTVNDDEGVYLYQAAMLLEGRLFLRPGAIPADAIRPWFFVLDETSSGVRLYSKYSPVAPALFAVGRVLGDWHVALGLVAAGSAALVYALGAAAFDRRVGLVAVVALAASPLFLFTSATFLAYAPTTLLNLAFAVAYVRAARTENRLAAVAAGVAIGLAFFTRPYTAVLFALPFIAHALLVLGVAWRQTGLGSDVFARVVGRYVAIALPGLAFVGVTLGYNVVVTGDPLVFPYAAFAPNDGLGFGPHELLGYEEDYTLALAVESSAYVVRHFFTEWTPAGLLGTGLAVVGFASFLWGRRPSKRGVDRAFARLRPSLTGMPDGEVAIVVASILPAVFVGEAYFWGTLNGIRNGLIDLLGPYYHFDALVPVSIFAAAGAVSVVRTVRDGHAARTTRRRARVGVLVVLLVTAPVAVVAEASVLEDPIAENRQRTQNLAATYEPFERQTFEDAVVFTPDTYGDWQAHPYQYLRSDPGFDGPVVFATDGSPARDVAVLDATDRTPYRFTHRGEWTGATEPVTPAIQRLEFLEGERVDAVTSVGPPQNSESVTVRIETREGYARYDVPASARTDERVTIEWTVGPEGARATNLAYAAGSGTVNTTDARRTVPLPTGASEVDVVATFVGVGGSTVTYRQEATVDASQSGVRVVWPPETRVCLLTDECGTEGTWVGPDGDYVDGVAVEMDARARNQTG